MYKSISEIHAEYRNGTSSVKDIVLAYLTRIAEVDSVADGLRSVAEINPDILSVANALDRGVKKNKTNDFPPLFGIPILLKDNINTRDKLHTTAGSLALADNYAPYDAHITTLLRQAGAIILGKANMTEFASIMTRENMPNGYSSRGGLVLNPHNRKQDPSGSSSGSAVAVAAGLCAVSVGTETSGSIISPAGENGVVGIKPTGGLVSQHGIVPISGTFDTAGPMARSVEDAAILLGVLVGKDYTPYVKNADLRGVRIGLNRAKVFDDLKEKPHESAAFNRLCDLLTEAGAVLVDDIEMEKDYETRMTIVKYEFKAALNHYLSTLSNAPSSLAEIIGFNQTHAATALKYGQSLLLEAQNHTSGTLTEPDYLYALIKREQAIKDFDDLFDWHGVDILWGENFAYHAPYTGHPSMSLPTGQDPETDMPHKACFAARRNDEGTLIKIGQAIEKLLNITLRPKNL
jgi:amidase